jgi:hypothetical protein
MSFEDTIRILLGRGAKRREPLDPAEWKRVKARVAWVRETIAALADAQARMHERCLAAVNRVPEEEFDRIVDEEQAKVCVCLDQLQAVRDHDLWPAHLYFGEI